MLRQYAQKVIAVFSIKGPIKCFALVLCLCAGLSFSPIAWSGAKSGFYLGGSLGQSDQHYDAEDAIGIDVDDDADAIKAFGGYSFGLLPSLNLAIEVSLIDFADVFDESTENVTVFELGAANAFGLVGVDLGAIGLFAKAGLTSWQIDSFLQDTSSDDSGTDLVAGVGIRFYLRSVALRLEYEDFDIEGADVTLYSFGASWTF